MVSAALPGNCCWTSDVQAELGKATLRPHPRRTHDGQGHVNTGAHAQTTPALPRPGRAVCSTRQATPWAPMWPTEISRQQAGTTRQQHPRALVFPIPSASSPPTSRTASHRAGQQPSEEPGSMGGDGRAISRVNPRPLPDVMARQLAVTSSSSRKTEKRSLRRCVFW